MSRDLERAFTAKVDRTRARMILVSNRQAFTIGFHLMWLAIIGTLTRRRGIDVEFGDDSK